MPRSKDFRDLPSPPELIERLSRALDGARMGIWDWDLRDDSVRFDRRWCEQLGLDPASTPNRLETWSSRVHPDDLPHVLAAVRDHIEGRTSDYEHVYRIRHADGEWHHFLDRGRVSERDAAGQPVRVTGIDLDITRGEVHLQARLQQEQVLREFIALVPTPVALLDTQLRYVAASDVWVKALDLEGREYLGHDALALRPQAAPVFRDALHRALSGASLGSEEQRIDRPDGRERWMAWSVRPWRREGAITGVVMAAEDVTARVLRRREREEEIAASVGALALFAGGVSHEINTPLQALSVAGDLLERELAHPEPDRMQLRELTANVIEMTERASAITRALRMLARDARFDPEESVDVAAVLEHVEALHRTRFESSSVALLLINETNSTHARAHPSELLRMLMSLLENAFEAAQQRDRWVRLHALLEDGMIVFRVEDGGPGLAPEHVAQLGHPFFTTKPPGHGSGLGLHLVRTIAERSGGSLTFVAGAPNTMFELRVPAHEPACAPERAP